MPRRRGAEEDVGSRAGQMSIWDAHGRIRIEVEQRHIERALVRNAQTDAQRITVEVQGSKVILHGTVRSYAEKLAAADAAWSAPGVTEVENHIVVSPIP